MRELFVNAEDRLRAGWRLLFQFLLNDAGISLLGFVLLSAGALPGGAGSPPPPYLLYTGAALVATASVWFCGRSLDGRPFSGFGLRLDRAWWSDLGFGLVLGASLMTGIFLLQLAAGVPTFEEVELAGVGFVVRRGGEDEEAAGVRGGISAQDCSLMRLSVCWAAVA